MQGNTVYGDSDVDYSIEEILNADYNEILGNISNKPILKIGAHSNKDHNIEA